MKLDALRDLLIRLELDYGYKFVCVGGAARDTFLGREPKDYDIVLLTPIDNVDRLRTALSEASGTTSIAELGQQDIENYESARKDRGLSHVFEFYLPIGPSVKQDFPILQDRITVQALVFTEETTKAYGGDPHAVVEDHDCDLSKAWFEDVNGKLRVRVHPEFPSPYTGNVNSFRIGYSDLERKHYIVAKFPEFNHK